MIKELEVVEGFIRIGRKAEQMTEKVGDFTAVADTPQIR